MISLKQAKAKAFETARSNKGITKESLKETFEDVWLDMFSEVDQNWKEKAHEEYYNGYSDGADDSNFDTNFDWNNVTEESVTLYCYNRGLSDRNDDICADIEHVEAEYDYACCLEVDRILGK